MGFVLMNPLLRRLMNRGLLLSALLTGPAVLAQDADPFRPNAAGDYQTSQTMGNRGLYEVRHWLVVDRDPEGTNCRSLGDLNPLGRVGFGRLLETASPGSGLNQAVVSLQGKTWLRVRIPDWSKPPVEPMTQPSPDACLVRANAQFVVPVNVIDLQHVIWKAK